MVEQWMTDLPIGGMAIVAFTMIILAYIKAQGNSRRIEEQREEEHEHRTTCASQLTPYMLNSIKVNTELIAAMKEQNALNNEISKRQQESISKQHEAINGLVLVVHTLVSVTKETLDRVKYIEREGGKR